jgi:hypothetical protein
MDTNDAIDMHRPAADFRDYLEGAVVGEYRRRRRFRRLRAAAVVVVSIGIGMTTTLASAQVRQNAQKDSLREAAKAGAIYATVRYNLALAQLAEQQKKVAAGTSLASSVADAELEVAKAENEVAQIILNTRELEITGMPPRDDLNAPLVKGEDFVMERLKRQMTLVNRLVQDAERSRDDVARRVAVGVATDLDATDKEIAVMRARGNLLVLSERLKARTEFLEKGTPVAELARRIDLLDVQQQIQVAQRELANAQARSSLVERRQNVGAATKMEALEAQMNVELQKMQLQKLSLRLNQLRESGKGEGDQLAGGSGAR